MKQREDYAEAIRIKERWYEESWKRKDTNPSQQTNTLKSEANRSQDSVKEPNELTRTLHGDGILLLPHQPRLRHGGNHQTNGGRHRVGMNNSVF